MNLQARFVHKKSACRLLRFIGLLLKESEGSRSGATQFLGFRVPPVGEIDECIGRRFLRCARARNAHILQVCCAFSLFSRLELPLPLLLIDLRALPSGCGGHFFCSFLHGTLYFLAAVLYFYWDASKNGLRGAKKLAFDWFFCRESLSL